jgi:predicted N-formylglutamate amidohydrolase
MRGDIARRAASNPAAQEIAAVLQVSQRRETGGLRRCAHGDMACCMQFLPVLASDEPSPVRVLRQDGTSDIFLTADHAGRIIPRALDQLGVPKSELARHIAWDIGIGGVTEHLSRMLDATAVLQTYSRLVIDCNRDPSVPTAMPEVSETTPIPGNIGLSAADRAARIAAIFAPYHAQIDQLLKARAAAGRGTIYVAMHSFTPVFKGESRAMHVGVLYHRDARLAHALLELLRAEPDLIVGDNQPYAITDTSDYGVPVHAEGCGLVHVEIEIRQDLIADEDGQAAWAARFARLLPASVARLPPA